jgi:membrane-associated phospholipid phosphatase
MRASLAALAAFTLVASLDEPTPLDRAVYARARRLHDSRFELAQRPLEIFGLPGVHIPVAFLAALALRRRGRRGGPTIAGAALSGWLAVRLMRALMYRSRPPRPPGRGPKTESTFPSGHTTELTSLAIAAAYILDREHILTRPAAHALGLGLPIVIGLNRVYVREHWLTDVLGGWALGAAVGLTCVSLCFGFSRIEVAALGSVYGRDPLFRR